MTYRNLSITNSFLLHCQSALFSKVVKLNSGMPWAHIQLVASFAQNMMPQMQHQFSTIQIIRAIIINAKHNQIFYIPTMKVWIKLFHDILPDLIYFIQTIRFIKELSVDSKAETAKSTCSVPLQSDAWITGARAFVWRQVFFLTWVTCSANNSGLGAGGGMEHWCIWKRSWQSRKCRSKVDVKPVLRTFTLSIVIFFIFMIFIWNWMYKLSVLYNCIISVFLYWTSILLCSHPPSSTVNVLPELLRELYSMSVHSPFDCFSLNKI